MRRRGRERERDQMWMGGGRENTVQRTDRERENTSDEEGVQSDVVRLQTHSKEKGGNATEGHPGA